jgi:RimJ/RimL family protein N-acetyltransferase
MAAGTPNDLTVRPLAPTELDLFVDMPGHQGPSHPNMDRDFFATIATTNYRPEWTWVAQRDGRVVARAAWWGSHRPSISLRSTGSTCMDALPGPREWWRLAFTSDGELVGISMPSRNFEDDVIGYIGVVPEQRGHHYADDLLAEATAILAELGSQRVTADTDTTNTPMAASFERAGYRNVGIRIVMG